MTSDTQYPDNAIGDLLRAAENAGAEVTRDGRHFRIEAPGRILYVARTTSPERLRERLRRAGVRL